MKWIALVLAILMIVASGAEATEPKIETVVINARHFYALDLAEPFEDFVPHTFQIDQSDSSNSISYDLPPLESNLELEVVEGDSFKVYIDDELVGSGKNVSISASDQGRVMKIQVSREEPFPFSHIEGHFSVIDQGKTVEITGHIVIMEMEYSVVAIIGGHSGQWHFQTESDIPVMVSPSRMVIHNSRVENISFGYWKLVSSDWPVRPVKKTANEPIITNDEWYDDGYLAFQVYF